MKKPVQIIKNECGNAIILVLLLVIILMSLGTMLLMNAVAHSKQSQAVQNKMKNYYHNDDIIENQCQKIDQLLKQSEKIASTYINQAMYEKEHISSNVYDENTGEILKWKNTSDFDIHYGDEENNLVYNMAGYYNTAQWQLKDDVLGESLQDRYYRQYFNYKKDIVDASSQSDKDIFYINMYNEIYYIVSYELLTQELQDTSTCGVEVIYQRKIENYSQNRHRSYPEKYIYHPEILITLETKTNKNNIKSIIEVTDNNYQPITSTKYKNIYFSPILSYVIASEGKLTFNQYAIDIYGDVYADPLTENTDYAEPGVVHSCQGINIYGNLYSSKNIEFDEVMIHYPTRFFNIYNYNDQVSHVEYKKHLFNDKGSEDNGVYYVSDANRFEEEDKEGKGEFWFLNQDNLGGNVYTNEWIVDVNNQQANIETYIQGNLWMNNDLKINSGHTSVEIGKIILGLNDSVDMLSPNQSSTINNNSISNSNVTINKFFIPGLSYYAFDGYLNKSDLSIEEKPTLFGTIESISGNNPSIFDRLYAKSSKEIEASDIHGYLKKTADNQYIYYLKLYDMDISERELSNEMAELFNNNETLNKQIGQVESHMNTGINFKENPNDVIIGYAQGLTFFSKSQQENQTMYGVFKPIDLYERYIRNKPEMIKLQKEKTQGLGLYEEGRAFHEMIDKNAISYLPQESQILYIHSPSKVKVSDGEITIKTDNSVNVYPKDSIKLLISDSGEKIKIEMFGENKLIVYAMDDLEMIFYEDSVLKGSVISEGDIEIGGLYGSNLPRIIYDDEVIAQILGSSPLIQKFFIADQSTGSPIKIKYIDMESGNFVESERLEVIQWKEIINEK